MMETYDGQTDKERSFLKRIASIWMTGTRTHCYLHSHGCTYRTVNLCAVCGVGVMLNCHNTFSRRTAADAQDTRVFPFTTFK